MEDYYLLDKIVTYIKEQGEDWQLPYLPSLEILVEYKEEVDSELLDEISKNMMNLIYAEKNVGLFGNDSVAQSLLMYNAYIFFVEKSLNCGENSYYFMLFPGMTEDVGALEVFRKKEGENTKHVFMMDLPVSKMNQSPLTPIVLCHELAHYVGSSIRSRTLRINKLYDICGRLIILGMQTSFMNLSDIDTGYVEIKGSAWNIVENGLKKWIQLYYSREKNPEYISQTGVYESGRENDVKSYNSQNMQHMFFLYPTILDSIHDMLKYKGYVIFEPVITDCFKNMGYREREERIQRCIEKIITQTHPDNSAYSISGALTYVRYILKESYADLISILELKLSPYEYLNCIVSQYPDVLPNKYGIKVCARIGLVVYTMCNVNSELEKGYTWTDEEISFLLASDTNEGKMLNQATSFIWNFIDSSYFEDRNELKKLSDQVYLIVSDQIVLQKIFEYLLECKQKFSELPSDEFKAVRAFYKGEDYEKYIKDYKEYLKGLRE